MKIISFNYVPLSLLWQGKLISLFALRHLRESNPGCQTVGATFCHWSLSIWRHREDEDGGEDLKLDEDPPKRDVEEEAAVVVKPGEVDDVMSKMKKDPDPEAYQPLRKRSAGPEIQGNSDWTQNILIM